MLFICPKLSPSKTKLLGLHAKGGASILLYKVLRFFCLKLKISITTEPIGFYILGKLHIGTVVFSRNFFHISF